VEGFDFSVGFQKDIAIANVVTMYVAKSDGQVLPRHIVGKCNVVLVLKVYHHAAECTITENA